MHKKICNISLILLIAFLCTVIAINGKTPFYIPGDGAIHLSRFEQVFQSLKNGAVPSEVSFIGPGHNLNALMSCYPWLGGLLFILPRFIFKNVVLSIAVGMFLINVLTVFNMYYLGKRLSSDYYAVYAGVIIYIFNPYHLILMYSRMAFGEFLAYAFIPLAVAGYLEIIDYPLIKRSRSSGVVPLSIGMSGIANSHFLTLALVTVFIFICTLILLLTRKINYKQLKELGLAGVISIGLSLYSLYGLLKIKALNSIIMPFKALVALSPKYSFIAQLKLIISESPVSWNIGIVSSIMLIILIIYKNKNLRIWVYSACSFYVLSYIPFGNLPIQEKLIDTFGFLQFQGRLLTYVVLCLAIAVTIFMQHVNLEKEVVFLLSIVMIVFAVVGIIKLENNRMPKEFQTRSSNYYLLSNEDYYQNVYNPVMNCLDYLPGSGSLSNDPGKGKIYTHGDSNLKMQWLNSTYNSSTFKLVSPLRNEYPINVGYYKGVKYKLFLNNKEISNLSKKQFLIQVPRGKSLLKIESDPSTLTVVMISLTLLVNVLFYGIVICKYFYSL